MKASSILLAAGFILLPWCLTPLFSQHPNSDSNKKITIIKHTVEADGTEVTETIVKKGKAAADFDVDQYVRENENDQNQVEVIINDGDDDNLLLNLDNIDRNIFFTCDDGKGAFLGVSENDDDEDAEGLSVNITSGSGAQKAAYAKGTIIIHVQQKDKVYTEQIIVQ